MSENILSVQNLHTSFHTDKGEVKAVNGVTFNLEKGKIVGNSLNSFIFFLNYVIRSSNY